MAIATVVAVDPLVEAIKERLPKGGLRGRSFPTAYGIFDDQASSASSVVRLGATERITMNPS